MAYTVADMELSHLCISISNRLTITILILVIEKDTDNSSSHLYGITWQGATTNNYNFTSGNPFSFILLVVYTINEESLANFSMRSMVIFALKSCIRWRAVPNSEYIHMLENGRWRSLLITE